MTLTPVVFHRLRPTWTSRFGQVIDLLHHPVNHFSKEFPHLMSMIIARRRGAAQVTAPTTPVLPQRATASAAVVLVLGATGCAATDAAPTPGTTVAEPASGEPSAPACPRPDAIPAGTPPARQLIGPTTVRYPRGAASARPHLLDIARRVTSGPAGPARCGRYDYVHVRAWTADSTVALDGRDGQATDQITLSDHRRWAGDNGSARVDSTAAAEFYTWHLPSRAQRAAIAQVLADRNLIWRGPAVERQGRRGVAVSADSDRGTTRGQLILDPTSGEVLAYERLAVTNNPGLHGGPFPLVLTYRIYLDRHRQDGAS